MTSDYYGSLQAPNIGEVVYGGQGFVPWYGNPAYFDRNDQSSLGFKQVVPPGAKRKPKVTKVDGEVWIDTLYVCHNCFQYSETGADLAAHLACCDYGDFTIPQVGTLMYWDKQRELIIRRVRGLENPLFCQNLALFGKLFLDDKSVFFNIEQFDFYVLWGKHGHKEYLPMGFFSKEMVSWDNTNNLACICVFPPFQRRSLGWLLIEVSYAVARHTPGQLMSGPEFPLSPYGRVSYLRFWSVKLAHYIHTHLTTAAEFEVETAARDLGFRPEDILITLSHMGVVDDLGDELELRLGAVVDYCEQNKIDITKEKTIIDWDAFLLHKPVFS